MQNKFVSLSEGFTLKNRNGIWRIRDASDKFGESYDMGQDEADVLMDLFGGASLENVAGKHSRSYDELGDFVDALSAEGVLHKTPVGISSMERCFPDPHPLDSVCLLITNGCNLRCRHCYMSSGDGFSRELTGEQWIEVLQEARGLGATGINISGGEPLMHPDFESIAAYLANVSQFQANLNTNGLLLNRQDINLLGSAFASIQVSLDDANAAGHDAFRGRHGAFYRTVNAIRGLVEAEIETHVAFTATPANIANLMGMVDLCVQLGVSTLNIGMPVSAGRAESLSYISGSDFFRRLYEASKEVVAEDFGIELLLPFRIGGTSQGVSKETRLLCGGENRQVLYVHADGEAVPCDKLPVEVFGAGNVSLKSLREIWYSQSMMRFKRMSPLDLPRCKECDLLKSCGGACVARAYCEFGALTAEDSASCFMARQHHLDTSAHKI